MSIHSWLIGVRSVRARLQLHGPLSASLLVLALLCLANHPARATDGYFDTGWTNSGRFPFDGPNVQEHGVGGRAIVTQPNGSLLLAGRGSPWWLAELSVDGQFVSTFGTTGSGIVSGCELGLGCNNTADPIAIFLQPDGKILVLQPDWGLVRIGAGAHSMDTTGTYTGTGSVNMAGWTFTDHSGSMNLATSIALEYDGKILVAGSGRASNAASVYGFAVIRLSSDLSLDTSFAVHTADGIAFAGGNTFLADGADLVERVTSVISQADGFILLVGVGSHNADGSAAHLELARLNPQTGLLDTNFNNDGVSVLFYPSGTLDANNPVAARSDGLLRTTFATTNSDGSGMLVARSTETGSPDPGFGSGGFTLVNACPYNVARSLVLDGAGRILVAGSCTDAVFRHYFTVIRVRGDTGALDTGFGLNGISLGWFDDTSGEGAGFGIAFDGSGHPVVIGDSVPLIFPYLQGVARLTYDLTYINGFDGPRGCLPPDCT